MATFKEQQELLTQAQHQLAVWEAVYKFVDENFIARDGGNPKKAIVAHDCLVQIVSEDTLEEVLKDLAQDKILPLQKTIQSINEQDMVIMPNEGDN